MFGELAIALTGTRGSSFFLLGGLDDFFRFTDRFFQGGDNFGRGLFAEIKEQLTFTIDTTFTPTPEELLEQFFNL